MNQHRANNPGYDKPPWKEETGGVRAVERAADILACLGKNDLSLSEISKEVGLNVFVNRKFPHILIENSPTNSQKNTFIPVLPTIFWFL
jgi:hypothetical protein